jgi:H2-forming N5,N10-methylenetetrahydromethanopterin dehydrogenase-like enzyme
MCGNSIQSHKGALVMKKALKTLAMATVIFTMTGCGLAEQVALVPFKVAAGVVVPVYEMGSVMVKLPMTAVHAYKSDLAMTHQLEAGKKMLKRRKLKLGKKAAESLNQEQTAAW